MAYDQVPLFFNLNFLELHLILAWFTQCLQHKQVTGDAVSSFAAQVDAHDCQMYIFTPRTVTRSVI